MNFDKEEYYVNRELSWLEFNQRILNEAKDNDVSIHLSYGLSNVHFVL